MTVELRESYTMDPTFFEFFRMVVRRPLRQQVRRGMRASVRGNRWGQEKRQRSKKDGRSDRKSCQPSRNFCQPSGKFCHCDRLHSLVARGTPSCPAVYPSGRPGTESKPEPPRGLGAQAGTHRGIWQDNADDALGVTAHLIRLECEHYALWHESRNGGHTRAGC